jgi:hypothetical protein
MGRELPQPKSHSDMKLYSFVLCSIACLLCSCIKAKPPSDEVNWWDPLLRQGKTPIVSFRILPGETKNLKIQGNGEMRIGALVREADEMKASIDKSRDLEACVYLEQISTKKYVGTYYSASVVFDVSKEQEFIVRNRSSVSTDVLVFRDPIL